MHIPIDPVNSKAAANLSWNVILILNFCKSYNRICGKLICGALKTTRENRHSTVVETRVIKTRVQTYNRDATS